MICRDIAVVDTHPEHWNNLVRGPGPAQTGGSDPGPGGFALLVQRDDRIVHAALRGRPVTELIGQPAADLEALRERLGVRRVICLEQGFLRRALTRSDSSLRYDMDYVEQLMLVVRAFRDERGTGIRMAPPSPPGPLPPFAWVQTGFDLLWPDGTSVVLYVVDEAAGRTWTSLILRKRAGDVDLLTTDLHLGAAGLDPERWREDRSRLLSEVERRVAPVFAGCFASLPAWRAWLADPFGPAAPGLVVDPSPRRLSWPVRTARAIRRGMGWMGWPSSGSSES